MSHSVIESGTSRSFPSGHKVLQSARPNGEVLILVGAGAAGTLGGIRNRDARTAIVIELGTECLGVHTGESRGEEGSNILGFARYRLGNGAPTDLVELVRQPNTKPEALAAAKAVFEDCDLTVAVCNDFPGRIVDRLIRPYFNAALKRLDEVCLANRVVIFNEEDLAQVKDLMKESGRDGSPSGKLDLGEARELLKEANDGVVRVRSQIR